MSESESKLKLEKDDISDKFCNSLMYRTAWCSPWFTTIRCDYTVGTDTSDRKAEQAFTKRGRLEV